jgi:hypothetical protein
LCLPLFADVRTRDRRVDRLFGGPDKDFVNGLDGDNLDYLNCGPGEDLYQADPGDTVLDNCETNVG